MTLKAVSAADVLYLNLRERAAEFATLSSSGWSNRQISLLVLLEASLLGLLAVLGAPRSDSSESSCSVSRPDHSPQPL